MQEQVWPGARRTGPGLELPSAEAQRARAGLGPRGHLTPPRALQRQGAEACCGQLACLRPPKGAPPQPSALPAGNDGKQQVLTTYLGQSPAPAPCAFRC